MESKPGTYLLILRSMNHDHAQIGKRGSLSISPGWYFYVGSAFGPGGVQARVSRHLRSSKRLHWHIDFLLASGALHVEEVWWIHHQHRYECQWGKSVEMLITEIPMPRFGSSDCGCPAHLFFSSKRFSLYRDELRRNLEGISGIGLQTLCVDRTDRT